MAKFYDTLTERWFEMPVAPVIERSKPPTLAGMLSEKTRQNIRIAEHAHVWQAIEATATATHMSGACPDGSESAASES